MCTLCTRGSYIIRPFYYKRSYCNYSTMTSNQMESFAGVVGPNGHPCLSLTVSQVGFPSKTTPTRCLSSVGFKGRCHVWSATQDYLTMSSPVRAIVFDHFMVALNRFIILFVFTVCVRTSCVLISCQLVKCFVVLD